MLISKLKNSKLKLSCTGPGPTNTRDEVVVTGEYLGCIRTQVTLDSSHHINHHAHYSVSFTVPTASISSRELELRCHVSQTVISANCRHSPLATDLGQLTPQLTAADAGRRYGETDAVLCVVIND